MNLYEVIFESSYGKTKGDEDTIYLVRAPDFMSAVEFVSLNVSSRDHDGEAHPIPHVVHEIGIDASSHAEATGTLILRGPYIQCAYNYAWRRWTRKIENADFTMEWQEEPYITT